MCYFLVSVKQIHLATEVRLNWQLNVLRWIVNLNAFERLAYFLSAAYNTKELDLHGDEFCVLTEFVRLLAETGWLKHDVASRALFIQFERYFDVCVELEERDGLIGTEWSRVLQASFAPVLVILKREASEHLSVFKVFLSVGEEDQTFAHWIGTSSAGGGRFDGNLLDIDAFVVDVHESYLGLCIVAAEHLVVVNDEAVRDVLAVKASAFVALYNDRNVAVESLVVVRDHALLVFLHGVLNHEGAQLTGCLHLRLINNTLFLV